MKNYFSRILFVALIGVSGLTPSYADCIVQCQCGLPGGTMVDKVDRNCTYWSDNTLCGNKKTGMNVDANCKAYCDDKAKELHMPTLQYQVLGAEGCSSQMGLAN